MNWNVEVEQHLDSLMDLIKESIMNDAESFAEFLGKDEVSFQCLETGTYKAIALLNEINKTNIMKSLGPNDGMKLVNEIELVAKEDNVKMLYNEVMNNPDISDEMKNMLKKMGFDRYDDNKDDELPF